MKLLIRGSFHLSLILVVLLPLVSVAQAPPESASLESVINQYVLTYGISTSNRFKLAAYTELKGRFDQESNAVVLDFGKLGYMSFFERNCLLRLPDNKVYTLDHYEMGTPAAEAMDRQLHDLFERITMLSDGKANQDHVEFIDRHLARKNLEPFDKLFIRHILVHHGTYDPMLQEVYFDSRDLPLQPVTLHQHAGKMVRQSSAVLKMKLDATILRGWYVHSGGTVFVENVDRHVRFATGEEYDYNVAAFKIFSQKLFVQAVQYIAKHEADRLERLQAHAPTMNKMVTMDSEIEHAHAFASSSDRRQASYERQWRRNQMAQTQPLYTQTSWIPMMLNMLRNEQVNIGDDDVICYFVHLDVFRQIYRQLIPSERSRVNEYLSSNGLEVPVIGWAIAR